MTRSIHWLSTLLLGAALARPPAAAAQTVTAADLLGTWAPLLGHDTLKFRFNAWERDTTLVQHTLTFRADSSFEQTFTMADGKTLLARGYWRLVGDILQWTGLDQFATIWNRFQADQLTLDPKTRRLSLARADTAGKPLRGVYQRADSLPGQDRRPAGTAGPAHALQPADLAGFWQGDLVQKRRVTERVDSMGTELSAGKPQIVLKWVTLHTVTPETGALVLRPEGVWWGPMGGWGYGLWRVTCDSMCLLWLFDPGPVTNTMKAQQRFRAWSGALEKWSITTPRPGQSDTVGSAQLTDLLAKLPPRDSLFWAKVTQAYDPHISVYQVTLTDQQLALRLMDNAALKLTYQFGEGAGAQTLPVPQLPWDQVLEGVLKRP